MFFSLCDKSFLIPHPISITLDIVEGNTTNHTSLASYWESFQSCFHESNEVDLIEATNGISWYHDTRFLYICLFLLWRLTYSTALSSIFQLRWVINVSRFLFYVYSHNSVPSQFHSLPLDCFMSHVLSCMLSSKCFSLVTSNHWQHPEVPYHGHWLLHCILLPDAMVNNLSVMNHNSN